MGAPCRLVASLALALAVFLSAVAPQPQSAAAQSGPALLSGTPATLEATLSLGARAELPLTLRNESLQSVTPRLFEAFAPGATPTAAPASAIAAAGPDAPPLLDPQIALAQAADPEGKAEVIILLEGQADLTAAYTIGDWAERGRYVYTTLRDHAAQSQHDLRATLTARGLAYTPLWIVNAVAVRGTADDVAAIAGVPNVAALWASRVADLGAPPAASPAQALATCSPDAANICWNIARIGASRTWGDFGVTGTGITVATIDSGVRFDHPALLAQYRGNTADGISHDYNWFDAYGGQPAPIDSGNHGTHTMGTIVARGLSASEPAVGVAPQARWITARACSIRSCDEVDLIRAAQWMLAPTDHTGANPRPDLRPHVINNSWTGGRNASWFMGYVTAWRAAGIYPVFAAGNAGSLTGCSTVQSPGDYAQVTGVGATDASDLLTSFSSIGPNLDGHTKPDLVAPGQGVVSTLADQRIYGSNSGTSMAAPHVAGAVALLWSANPTLIGDYETTYALLTASAAPNSGDSRFLGPNHSACRPTTSPNNIYGHGRLDVYKAVAEATVDVPWLSLPAAPLSTIAPASSANLNLTLDARMVPGPGTYQARILVHGADLSLPPGVINVTMRVPADPSHATLSGRVTRAGDGAPLQATVRVAGGATVRSDANGIYRLVLPPAASPFMLSATARDYVAATTSVELAPGVTQTLDFQLVADLPRLAADTTPRGVDLDLGEQATVLLPVGNQGTRALSYTVSIPEQHYGVWRSDESDGPAVAWTTPPTDAVTVNLTDDGATEVLPIGFRFPFFYASYEHFAIAANGVIALTPLSTAEQNFTPSCLPTSETPGPAIIPLRLDLDPRQPGARVSYANLPEGLLVTWEEVPLFEQPDTRLSFQALLMPDGRISFRYKQIGALPAALSASAGLQEHLVNVQSLGCKAALPLADGLTIELRPQAPGPVWLTLGRPAGTVAPSTTVGVPVTARWIAAAPYARSFSGVVELRSNDPDAPVTRYTVRMRTAAAPHSAYFPQIGR